MTRAEERALEAYPYEGNDHRGIVSGAFRAVYARGYEQAEKDLGWISVKDRLPEKDGFYLTCVNQAGVAQCVGLQYFDTNLMKWRDFDEEVREVFIDYWMPIPELPKEEEQ